MGSLSVVSGPDKGRRFELPTSGELAIGRGQASDTKINDPRMSRVHCRIKVDGGQVKLVDAGSTGGTLINNTPITEQTLRPGTVFRIGDTELRFDSDNPHEQSTIAGNQAFGRPRPAAKETPLQELVGETLASYRLDSIIKQGASGAVFKATETESQQTLAVKVLTPELARSEEQKERFIRAMKTTLPIRHPNIVRLYNAGKKGPYCWLAMEYVDGESMTQVIDRIGVENMLDWRQVWRVGLHIGRALAEAYKLRIIHRNVTPPNILQRSSDKVCLLGDLVLAKALEGTLARQVTQPGQLVGEVAYMSPERTHDGAEVDHRSDLYGLGATLYALLTGHAPLEHPSLVELIRMVREVEPKPPKEYQLSIDEQFQDIVLHMLRKDPKDRYASPQEFLDDLERLARFHNLPGD